MSNKPGYNNLMLALETINLSQRGSNEPRPIEVVYSFHEPQGTYAIRFSEESIAHALEDEGFDVEKREQGFCVLATDEWEKQSLNQAITRP